MSAPSERATTAVDEIIALRDELEVAWRRKCAERGFGGRVSYLLDPPVDPEKMIFYLYLDAVGDFHVMHSVTLDEILQFRGDVGDLLGAHVDRAVGKIEKMRRDLEGVASKIRQARGRLEEEFA